MAKWNESSRLIGLWSRMVGGASHAADHGQDGQATELKHRNKAVKLLEVSYRQVGSHSCCLRVDSLTAEQKCRNKAVKSLKAKERHLGWVIPHAAGHGQDGLPRN